MTDLDQLHHAIRACAARHGINETQLAEAVIARRQRLRYLSDLTRRAQIEERIKRNHNALIRAMMSAQEGTKAVESIKKLGVSLERMNTISRTP
ncbi:hypothetical protein [Roseovarius sp. MMSF_3281]|uniref:hypothetical protein n=1 Tax=Roseovarius sp. MMSF_3281 TaxID=3046694 RepID=UPI00273DD376|nr:hypothetical protein [Roseovarius sp. MMSF_3281]